MICKLQLVSMHSKTHGRYVCPTCTAGIILPCAIASKTKKRCPGVPPTIAERTANFMKALAGSHEVVSDAEFAKRDAACGSCIRFCDPTHHICLHPDCGCTVCGKEQWFDKRRLKKQKCPVGRWDLPKWISTAQRVRDTQTLMGMIPTNAAAIIGVARSGVAPAAEIAMGLHLPLFIFDDVAGILREAGHGQRLKGKTVGDGPWIVVDDSMASGRSMVRGRAALVAHPLTRHKKVMWSVLYTHPTNPIQPDLSVTVCHEHHLFEWNFPNSIYAGRCGWDIDGVLVTENENPGRPYLVPRRQKVPLIATGRFEHERKATEEQLAWLGVTYDRLEMFPGTDADRKKEMAISRHKAKHYLADDLDWFIESCPIQAKEIAGLTGKRVICPFSSEVF